MKTIKILQAAVLSAILFFAASCSPGRGYRNYPSNPAGVSLIISPAPGLVVRYAQGGYYYRDPRGFVYWRGPGNRYYLDRRYMSRGYEGHPQYREWRRYDGRHRGHR